MPSGSDRILRPVARALDGWVAARNRRASEEGGPRLRRCQIRVLGQTALLEARTALTLAATQDVDVYADYEHAVEVEFEHLLARRGRTLDPLGHEVWMPKETEYTSLFTGSWVEASLADVDSILISEALKAPDKNRALLLEYLATGPTPRFMTLARRYRVDLEGLL